MGFKDKAKQRADRVRQEMRKSIIRNHSRHAITARVVKICRQTIKTGDVKGAAITRVQYILKCNRLTAMALVSEFFV